MSRPDEERRHRLLVNSALAVAAITFGLAGARFALEGTDSRVGLVLLATAGGFALTPVVWRATGSDLVAGCVIPSVGLVGIMGMALTQSGLSSESLLWAGFVPLVAVLFVGVRGAVAFGIVGLVLLGAVFTAEEQGWIPGAVPMSTARLTLKLFGAAGSLGFGAVLGWLYETSRARAAAALDAERQASARAKDEFLATVSHELRTPLTSIQGYLGLMSGGAFGELSEEARDAIAVSVRNAARLGELIDDLLDLQQLEAGVMSFDLTDTAIADVLRECVEQGRGYAGGRDISIELADAPDARVHADPERLQQAIGNLVSNAVKFSPPGGTVRVAATVADGRVRVSVADDGPGIPEAFRDRIFQRFARADDRDARDVGGTGLGLNIARGIVQRHGGRISFDTATERGTTFYVDLPAS